MKSPKNLQIHTDGKDPISLHFCHAMRCISAAYAVAQCLSVYLSVTFVYWVKTIKDIFKTFSPSGCHTVLVFCAQTVWQYSDGTPLVGVSNAGGIKKSRFSTNILLYLLNDAKYGHSYYGSRIENRTKAFENGTIFNDLDWPLTQISRSRCYSMSNNWKMVRDSAVTIILQPLQFVYNITRLTSSHELCSIATKTTMVENSLMHCISSRCDDAIKNNTVTVTSWTKRSLTLETVFLRAMTKPLISGKHGCVHV